MTAGHNLVGADGQRSERLKILTLDGKSVPIDNDSFKICDDYKEQNPSRKAYDWGAIMLKDSKDIDAEGSGFGFSLSLAVDCEGYEDMVEQVEREKNNPLDKLLKSGNINVSGYRAQDPAATPALSSGHGFVRNTNQLEYAVRTQPGVSGSPVWAAYNRVETVIAIQ